MCAVRCESSWPLELSVGLLTVASSRSSSPTGFGEHVSLEHPTGPHSHSADLRPRGYTAVHAVALHGAQASLRGVEQANSHARGFGFSKLESLQNDIQAGLHNFFQHGEDDLPPHAAHAAHAAHDDSDPAAGATETTTTDHPAAEASDASAIVGVPLKAPLSVTLPNGGMTNPAIVVLTYQRRTYLMRTLDSLMDTPGVGEYAVYVSQDGSHPDLSDIPPRYLSRHEITLLNHVRSPLLSSDQSATAYLAQHYKWVLDKLFFEQKHSHVVILEDDMILSPDFLTLFTETAHLLDTDPTLMCVSSWNDNGMTRLVADRTRLMRTDYFPGLGWMTNAAIWSELSPQFPLDQWDHFMRLDTTHRGRDCLIPEVARNHNIGEEGTNMGANFYQRFLAPIAFNTKPTSFLHTHDGVRNLEHMRSETFEREMHEQVGQAKMLGMWDSYEAKTFIAESLSAQHATAPEKESVVILYDRAMYPSIAAKLGLLPVPRSIHKGLITIRLG